MSDFQAFYAVAALLLSGVTGFALVTGRIVAPRIDAYRDEEPVLYWAGCAITAAVAIYCVYGALSR